jgi:nitrogenase molybdenum-iron protein alpha chain
LSTKEITDKQQIIEELLEVYPERTKKFKKKHFQVVEEENI